MTHKLQTIKLFGEYTTINELAKVLNVTRVGTRKILKRAKITQVTIWGLGNLVRVDKNLIQLLKDRGVDN